MDTKKKKALFLKAYEQKACNITEACKSVAISRRTFYVWKEGDKAFFKDVQDIDASLVDMAESSLLLQIKKGNMTGIIFFLTNKASDRWKHKSEQVQRIEFEGDLNVSDKFRNHAETIAKRFNLPM